MSKPQSLLKPNFPLSFFFEVNFDNSIKALLQITFFKVTKAFLYWHCPHIISMAQMTSNKIERKKKTQFLLRCGLFLFNVLAFKTNEEKASLWLSLIVLVRQDLHLGKTFCSQNQLNQVRGHECQNIVAFKIPLYLRSLRPLERRAPSTLFQCITKRPDCTLHKFLRHCTICQKVCLWINLWWPFLKKIRCSSWEEPSQLIQLEGKMVVTNNCFKSTSKTIQSP